MPLWSFWRIFIWSFSLLRMLGNIWYQAKSFIFKLKYLILASKCLSNRKVEAMGFILPISVSKFLDFVLSFDKMPWIVFVEDMNLGSGKLTHNVSVLYTHPKTTLISSNDPPAFDFDVSII